VFCSKSETPKKLFELLGVKNEERKADDWKSKILWEYAF
jgi:hypothetical protein